MRQAVPEFSWFLLIAPLCLSPSSRSCAGLCWFSSLWQSRGLSFFHGHWVSGRLSLAPLPPNPYLHHQICCACVDSFHILPTFPWCWLRWFFLLGVQFFLAHLQTLLLFSLVVANPQRVAICVLWTWFGFLQGILRRLVVFILVHWRLSRAAGAGFVGCLPAVSALCPFGIAHSLLKSLRETAGGPVPIVVPQCSVCIVFALRLPGCCLDCRAV